MGVPKIALIMKYESPLPFENGVFNNYKHGEESGESKNTVESTCWTFSQDALRFVTIRHHLHVYTVIRGIPPPEKEVHLRSSPPPLFDLVRKVPEITVEVPGWLVGLDVESWIWLKKVGRAGI